MAFHLVQLDPGSEGYDLAVTTFSRGRSPCATVHSVKEIVNPTLTSNFSGAASGIGPVWMFHGTPETNVESNCRTGFDAARFGQIWFAKESHHSIAYSEKNGNSGRLYMFLSKVNGPSVDCIARAIKSNCDALPVYLIEFTMNSQHWYRSAA